MCEQYQVRNMTSDNTVEDLISQATHTDSRHIVERTKLRKDVCKIEHSDRFF